MAPGNAARTVCGFIRARHCDDLHTVGKQLAIQPRETIPCLELSAMKSDRDRAQHDVLRADVVRGEQLLRTLSSGLADAQSQVARNVGRRAGERTREPVVVLDHVIARVDRDRFVQ